MKQKTTVVTKRLVFLKAISLVVALASSGAATWAQTGISTDGIVKSTGGGFEFPDGTVQKTAASGGEAPVGDTGQQSCFDPTGATFDEVPCAMTGQDGELQRGVAWPTPRFKDNLNGSVSDELTGLVWLKDANCSSFSSPVRFEVAIASASGLSDGACGLTDGSVPGDWRLPNIRELLSLVDYGETSPALPSGHPFFNVEPAFYWTSTTVVSGPVFAWIVFVNTGSVTTENKGAALHLVWPVRGGR